MFDLINLCVVHCILFVHLSALTKTILILECMCPCVPVGCCIVSNTSRAIQSYELCVKSKPFSVNHESYPCPFGLQTTAICFLAQPGILVALRLFLEVFGCLTNVGVDSLLEKGYDILVCLVQAVFFSGFVKFHSVSSERRFIVNVYRCF